MSFQDDLRRDRPEAAQPATGAGEACADCARLTASHYENFSVVTWLTPRVHRPAFQSIYAFCCWSDDLGDEIDDPSRSLGLLAWWRRTPGPVRGPGAAPVMVAPAETVWSYPIPIDPFEALISAFEQDQKITEYPTFSHLLDYCTRSANPVGHLILHLAGAVRRERPPGRRHLYRAATGKFLAGRGPRPGNRPRLPAPRGPRALRLSRGRSPRPRFTIFSPS